jgi:uncharacterized protein (TIGR03437 family)
VAFVLRLSGLILFASAVIVGAAQTQELTVVSAASPYIGVTADSLAAVFGSSISTQTMAALSVPWPTTLGDISAVDIKDSAGQTHAAGIVFVSPFQMNIYIPAGVASGLATISYPIGLPPGVGMPALRQAAVNIQNRAPALFSAAATGMGVAAATAVRVTIPTQMQSNVPVFVCDGAASCNPVAIEIGVDAPVYVSLFGSGFRNASSVTVTIGNLAIQPSYSGPQLHYPGLDQVNFALPLALRGSGLVYITLTADGVRSNVVELDIQ